MKKILTSLVSATMLLSMSTTLAHAQNISLGANVNADTTSPSGYTVTFNYDTSDDTKWTDQSKIKVTGSFDYYREGTTSPVYTPEQYENGMNPANTGNYSKEMADEDGDRIYSTSFPITSGAFQYSYVLDYDGDFNTKDDQITIADPHNLARFNSAQSTYETSCLNTSVVYGKYDAVKQSQSHDYSFVLPATQNQGSVDYVNYTGSLTNKDLTDVEVFDKTTKTHQNLGIYLPSGYDAQRQEPYKVIYLSHGGGGNEVDWFSYGHVDNIMDNLINNGQTEPTIVVTVSNMDYRLNEIGTIWNFDLIRENVTDYVIPYVESHYNVSKDAQDRAFAGLSMGSLTTSQMWLKNCDSFGYFGAFSGAYLFTDMYRTNTSEDLQQLTTKTFDQLNQSKLLVAGGYTDIALGTMGEFGNGRSTGSLDYLLKKYNFTNYKSEVVDGAHDWFTWSQLFKEFASEVVWTNENKVVEDDKKDNVIESPKTEEKVSAVKTGDQSLLELMAMLSVLSTGAFVGIKKYKNI